MTIIPRMARGVAALAVALATALAAVPAQAATPTDLGTVRYTWTIDVPRGDLRSAGGVQRLELPASATAIRTDAKGRTTKTTLAAIVRGWQRYGLGNASSKATLRSQGRSIRLGTPVLADGRVSFPLRAALKARALPLADESASPTASDTASPTASPEPSASATTTSTPTPTPTSSATSTATPTATPTATTLLTSSTIVLTTTTAYPWCSQTSTSWTGVCALNEVDRKTTKSITVSVCGAFSSVDAEVAAGPDRTFVVTTKDEDLPYVTSYYLYADDESPCPGTWDTLYRQYAGYYLSVGLSGTAKGGYYYLRVS